MSHLPVSAGFQDSDVEDFKAKLLGLNPSPTKKPLSSDAIQLRRLLRRREGLTL